MHGLSSTFLEVFADLSVPVYSLIVIRELDTH
jgi:hypothetical protein